MRNRRFQTYPAYQFVSVFAQVQGFDKAIILFQDGPDCPAILYRHDIQSLSLSASYRPHSHSQRERRPLGSNDNFEDCKKVMIAERTDEPGVPVTGSVQ
jgi:hypothetical protein